MKNYLYYLVLAACLLMPSHALGKNMAIQKQSSALDQFYHAMETYYFPASKAIGDERKKLAKQAAEALSAVWKYFPDCEDQLILMEAYYYQGMSFVELGESKKAMEAFYSCFSNKHVPAAATNDYEADMMSYKNDAWYALMELREYLPPEYLNYVDLYKPL